MRTILFVAVQAAIQLGCAQNAPPPASRTDSAAVASSAEAAGASQPAGNSAQAGEPAAGSAAPTRLGRQIIYTADMRLVVEEFSGIPEKVAALVKQHEGFIANSQLAGRSGSPRNGVWKIRVPVKGYGDFIESARSLGEVLSVSTDSQDVSEEYYDIDARIRNKQKEETRLLKHLEDNTGKLDEILAVEREISRVREELERMEGRLRVLKDLTALTTITLRIDEIKGYVPAQTPTLARRVERAFTISIDAMRDVAEALLVAGAALAPWFVALGIPILVLVWCARRFRRPRSIWMK